MQLPHLIQQVLLKVNRGTGSSFKFRQGFIAGSLIDEGVLPATVHAGVITKFMLFQQCTQFGITGVSRFSLG